MNRDEDVNRDIERNLGEQPIARLLANHGLKPQDLVAASTEQITHKMVSRGCKGRRLTLNIQSKLRNALNRATEEQYSLKDLFSGLPAVFPGVSKPAGLDLDRVGPDVGEILPRVGDDLNPLADELVQ